MIKICGYSIYETLRLIFVPVYDNGNKQTLENYCPLPQHKTYRKIQYLIYSSLFDFFTENDLISSNYFGFQTLKYINPLIMDMKLQLFSLVYQKHLIKFGKMDSFIN